MPLMISISLFMVVVDIIGDLAADIEASKFEITEASHTIQSQISRSVFVDFNATNTSLSILS